MGLFGHDCAIDGCSPEETGELTRRCPYCGRIWDFRNKQAITYADPERTGLPPDERRSGGSLFDLFL